MNVWVCVCVYVGLCICVGVKFLGLHESFFLERKSFYMFSPPLLCLHFFMFACKGTYSRVTSDTFGRCFHTCFFKMH